ncbi:MAG: hypothetical protein LBS38_00795 [Endomicrobium sp.]|jgi:hypothetical protein|nr:hypothetical protein [Endomicrobium sp.]
MRILFVLGNKTNLIFLFIYLSSCIFASSCYRKNDPEPNNNVAFYRNPKIIYPKLKEVPSTQDLFASSNLDTPFEDGQQRWILEFNIDIDDSIGITFIRDLSYHYIVQFNFKKISKDSKTTTAEAIMDVPYIREGNLQGVQIGTVQSGGIVHNLFACIATSIDKDGFYNSVYNLHLYLDECQVTDMRIVEDNNYIGTIYNHQIKKLCFLYANGIFSRCALLDPFDYD